MFGGVVISRERGDGLADVATVAHRSSLFSDTLAEEVYLKFISKMLFQ